VAGTAVATRPVAAADEHDGHHQQDHHDHEDAEYLHPPWQAGVLAGVGVAGRVNQLPLLTRACGPGFRG
jgi:hypothetical protein